MRELNYDVVIVGSGAGGGTVAKELAPLAREGKKIAVLEWGAKLAEEEYTGHEVDMAGKLYFDSGGVLTKDRAMTLAYGRAYGRLPESPAETTADQRRFLKRAVAGLVEEGKVICVRLALFAEMMKGKEWTSTTLRQIGGTEGVGVTFLKETFSERESA